MRVLFATAELAPLVRVGGLAYAAAGLVKQLHAAGTDITVVLPDYGTYDAQLAPPEPLDMPRWVGITTIRRGTFADGIPLVAVRTPGIDRPHPYNDATGEAWGDNQFRFMSFSAGVAELTAALRPDVLHINDWHTGAVLGLIGASVPSVYTIHNLAYQGTTNPGWLDVLVRRPEAYEWYGRMNPMSGAIALADYVVTVSPNYAREIRRPAKGAGLDGALRLRGDRLVGILNGIDTSEWDPATDLHLPAPFHHEDLSGKAASRRALLDDIGWGPTRDAVVGMVTRLTWQKGIDAALEIVEFLDRLPAKLIILGSGDEALADQARWATVGRGDRMAFVDGFDEGLAHRIFAGSDMLLMPSRFEPCGLAQMQAMRYGTIPVVTDVGGLHDTVIDADRDPEEGTGFVAAEPAPLAILDALHRAHRAWRSPPRRKAIQVRGMTRDWSWKTPAQQHMDLYEQLAQG